MPYFLSTKLPRKLLRLGHSRLAVGLSTLWNLVQLFKKEKRKCQNQLRKPSIIALQSSTSASSPPPPTPHINMKRKTDNAMIVSVNTMVQLSFHAHLHFYSRKRVTHLRELKEWELIFPTPLSNKATRLDSIISVSKDLHYPTCMGTAHLMTLTMAVHSYIWQSLLWDLSITHHQFTFDI